MDDVALPDLSLVTVVFTAPFTLRLVFVRSLPFSQASQIHDQLSLYILNHKP